MANPTPSKEKKMFTRYYSVFCDIIKHEDLLPRFVEKGIITADQLKEICAKSLSDKGPNFLTYISNPLDSDDTEMFITMLKVMKEYGTPDTQKFIVDVEVEMKDIGQYNFYMAMYSRMTECVCASWGVANSPLAHLSEKSN